jgi:hypothetical protein
MVYSYISNGNSYTRQENKSDPVIHLYQAGEQVRSWDTVISGMGTGQILGQSYLRLGNRSDPGIQLNQSWEQVRS